MNYTVRLVTYLAVIILGMFSGVELATPPPTGGLQFLPSNYSVTVLDNVTHILNVTVNCQKSCQLLINVTCLPPDSDPDACSSFFLNVKSQDNYKWIGQIDPAKQLTKSFYFFTLQAFNGESIFQNISIRVVASQRRPPEFRNSLTVYTPELNSTSNVAITQYFAEDVENSGQSIRYQLYTNPGNYFRIDDATGRLFNTKPILFSSPGWENGYLLIEVKAAFLLPSGIADFDNPSMSAKAQSTINLVEAIDHPPVFDYQSYTGAVDEQSPENTVVQGISLKVTDPDRSLVNSTFELYLDNYSNIFKVSPNNASRQTTASILVVNSAAIDYDVGPQSYQFQVIARETLSIQRMNSSAMVTINLIPKNNYPPVFTQSVYSVSISELINQGVIVQILATDKDVGRYGNSSIRYKFSEYTPLFRVNPVSGAITVVPCKTVLGLYPCIDYEVVKSYQLPVVATDSNGEGLAGQATVNITIIDENDNPPVFTRDTFYGEIEEHTTNPTMILPSISGSVPLQVNATDADSSFNGNNNVTYSIVGGNSNDLWSINPVTGVLNAKRPVNYTDSQLGFFSLSVEARDPDPTHVSRANVNISVKAVNFYSPVLENDGIYNTSILETTPPGTYVFTVKATDGDSPATPNGQIQYRFLSGSQDLFTISNVTGEVFVAPGAKFDAAVRNLYTISVQASDLGLPQHTDAGTLYIAIILNRPEPKFTSSVIRPPPVLQSSPNGTNVTTVLATNTNPNRKIYYSFVEPISGRNSQNQEVNLTPTERQMFAVDPVTGLVTVNKPLDYDRVATWQAIVQAVDNNTNSTDRTGTATIIITVQPVNTKPPVFNFPWTSENPQINKSLDRWDIPSNNVYDIDAATPNSSLVLTYQLIDDYNGAFNISSQTGVVGLTKPLNLTTDKDVKFVVIAVDNGQPQLTSTATVFVQLKNTNNNPPRFILGNDTTIPDDIQNGTVVLTVHATDPDYGDFGQVRYEFVNDSRHSRFNIDPMTGVITVAPDAQFSGSREPLIILGVIAYDSPNNPISRRSTAIDIPISVTTVNKDPPTFSQPSYSSTIPESIFVNSTFIQVLAMKYNTANSYVINYAITSGNDAGLFAIDSKTGAIRAQTSLNGKSGQYNLTVTATDDGTPVLTGTALVYITVLTSGYRPPTWIYPDQDSARFSINETDPRGTFVTKIQAMNNNSAIKYYFSSNNVLLNSTGDFAINYYTGDITTAREFPYEGGRSFMVTVAAIDDFNVPSSRIIFIDIKDVHLENPYFDLDKNNCSIPYKFKISRYAPNDSIVDTIMAHLTDPNDDINYQIINKPFKENIFELRPTQNRRGAQIRYFGNGVVRTPRMYNFTVRAQDLNFDVNGIPSKRFCNGTANQTDVLVFIDVIENLPQYEDDLHTCIRDDAEIGTKAYTFVNQDYDKNRPVEYDLAEIDLYSRNSKVSSSLTQFDLSKSGDVTSKVSMSDYKQHYFLVKARSTYDRLEYSYPWVTIYVVPYTREILVTFKQKLEDVKANIANVMREISNVTSGGKVCIVSYKAHVTDEGVVDSSRTDVLMYVIDGGTNDVVYPLVLDQLFMIGSRKATNIIGITEAYSYWDGFIYHPVAIAIGIIIGLLVIALLLFLCCCFIWSKLLALCRYTGDKEPLIYKASSLGVVNPVWTPKPQTEEQVLTMPVPDGEGINRTIELIGEYNRPAVDIGDEDVIDSASRFQTGAAAAGGAQSLSGYVHIEAPLTASRSPSAFGTPSAFGGASQTRQETTTIYESSATGGAHGGRESPYPDSHLSQHTSGPMDSHASYSASGAMKFTRGTTAEMPPPPRSHSTGTMTNLGVGATISGPEGPVRLNDPGDTGHGKIGATLFRPGGQAYAQSVISGTTMGGDQYDVVEDGAGLYGAPHDARLALPLDTEVMYSHMRPTSYYDDADIMPNQGGMYQGEVRVGRSSIISEQLQETRFM